MSSIMAWEKQQKMVQLLEPLMNKWTSWKRLSIPDFSLAWPGLLWSSGKSTDEWKLCSFSFPIFQLLFLSLCYSNTRINKSLANKSSAKNYRNKTLKHGGENIGQWERRKYETIKIVSIENMESIPFILSFFLNHWRNCNDAFIYGNYRKKKRFLTLIRP